MVEDDSPTALLSSLSSFTTSDDFSASVDTKIEGFSARLSVLVKPSSVAIVSVVELGARCDDVVDSPLPVVVADPALLIRLALLTVDDVDEEGAVVIDALLEERGGELWCCVVEESSVVMVEGDDDLRMDEPCGETIFNLSGFVGEGMELMVYVDNSEEEGDDDKVDDDATTEEEDEEDDEEVEDGGTAGIVDEELEDEAVC